LKKSRLRVYYICIKITNNLQRYDTKKNEKIQKIIWFLWWFLNWNKSRINFLWEFIESLIKVKTVNLKEVSNWMSWWKEESRYRKNQRFFEKFNFEIWDLTKIMLWILDIKWPYFLSMDRTNWKFWKANINILTIWIVYNKIAFPIAWTLLDKRWNSNCDERIEVLEKAIKVIWKENVAWLLADREFVWEKWFKYLINSMVPFWIRIKENFSIWPKQKVKTLFNWVWKEARFLEDKFNLKWNDVYISWVNNKWELLVVASNMLGIKYIENYKKRRSIEVLFFSIKSWGFNFEDTHMVDKYKLSKLFWIVAIAMAWCYKVWEKLENIKPTKIKKHWYKAISIFKSWLRFISHIFLNLSLKRHSNFIFKFLSCS